MECKNCTADLPLTLSGKYAGLCETCTDLRRQQDEKDQNRTSVYESNCAFAGAAIFVVLGLSVILFDLGRPAIAPRFLAGLFLVLGSFGAGVALCLIGIAAACYGVYVVRGGKPIQR